MTSYRIVTNGREFAVEKHSTFFGVSFGWNLDVDGGIGYSTFKTREGAQRYIDDRVIGWVPAADPVLVALLGKQRG